VLVFTVFVVTPVNLTGCRSPIRNTLVAESLTVTNRLVISYRYISVRALRFIRNGLGWGSTVC